jgi:hypothetical protein
VWKVIGHMDACSGSGVNLLEEDQDLTVKIPPMIDHLLYVVHACDWVGDSEGLYKQRLNDQDWCAQQNVFGFLARREKTCY